MNNESLSLKYQRFTQSGFKEIGIRTFYFAAKTKFLCRDTGVKFNLLAF